MIEIDSGYLRGPGTVCPKTPLHIREMTSKETIQQTKEDIALLQEKLKKLEELDRVKTPCREAYKYVYGCYPPTTPSVSNSEDERWSAFQQGYNASKEDCKVEEPKLLPIYNGFFEGNPPDGCSSWTEFLQEFSHTGNLRGLKISSLSNKVEEPKPKPGTLYWALKNLGNYDDDNCDEIADAVEEWLPDEIYIEFSGAYERGWNDALRTIGNKLR
jgi:hypothetical protein